MQIQKVFQAGNSQVVAIPKDLAQELGLYVGHKVTVQKTPDGEGLIVKRADAGVKKVSKSQSDTEFQSWLSTILDEDKELIQELAKR
jgi:putative addiction module antidote